MRDGGAGIGIISNPASGHNRDHFPALRRELERCPGALHRVTGSPGDVPAVLEEFAGAGVELLVINGGDGTAAAVLGQLLERSPFARLPLVTLLPAGTANMNAGDVGVRGSLRRAVSRFRRWAEDPSRPAERLQRRLLRVSIDDEPAAHYGMFLGAGAVVHGTEYAHREIHARGLRDDFSLFLGTLRTAWGVVRGEEAFTRPTRLGLTLDGRAAGEADALILAVSTLERLAFGMRPFWGRGPGPLRLTLIEQHAARFLPTFLSIIAGRPSRRARADAGYHSHNAQQLELALAGDLNLDGELLTVRRCALIEASAALVFLRP
ncbi:diacylglycerol/lipid kinase family protein [Pseudohaliea rubra]|uniref:DAG-kinase catalytic domain protein n=1 Tax=Pseudohaliea rubra DSM 19751 TaxID=1265313 RepID=A0A095VRI9_9GAMM|nr:diacylglycerol kinase family protein [Pseudohaliea rubra]KGE03990.1 DAG-kinase catalytic domain protein [Pseudohaliea rubra DSM 19751]